MKIEDMKYEYEISREYLLALYKHMSESEFSYRLGVLNTLAGYTNNLDDYIQVLTAINEGR